MSEWQIPAYLILDQDIMRADIAALDRGGDEVPGADGAA